MNYDDIAYKNKGLLREKLIELSNKDIAEAECFFSSRNFAFAFSEGCFPIIIRVGINPNRSISNILSELMWVDDLKTQVEGIAHMIPFSDGSIKKPIHIGDDLVVVSMFRKIHGAVAVGKERDDQFFEMAGTYLGKIHCASKNEVLNGFKFKRLDWHQMEHFDETSLVGAVSDKAIENYRKVKNTIRNIDTNPDNYGMIHGDFQVKNMYRDWDNLWIFDFDDCCYHYYMMDIATFINAVFSDGTYEYCSSRKDETYRILSIFRKGYEKHMTLSEDLWSMFDDFVKLRIGESMILLNELDIPLERKKPILASLAKIMEIDDDFYSYYD